MYKVGLFNDSFPPTIDGVANTVYNYANIMNGRFCEPVVITPKYPNVVDNYDFEVYRYNSAKLTTSMPYRVGNPFSPKTLHDLAKMKFDILHVHSPFASSVLAHEISLLYRMKVPTILTYHTKFDIDIDNYVDNKPFNIVARKFVETNIGYADEVWTVSEGTLKSLRNLGYEGDVVIMPNGTDFVKGKASKEDIAEIDRIYRTENEPLVFLYCGRMNWYKNLKITLDALKILSDSGIRYKMFFLGEGPDRPMVEAYAKQIGVSNNTIFCGAIYDREKVRAYFSRADLFLFPSTYDTSGLVVKEAAACNCASVLIKGSCAAEGVEDGISGFIADEETSDSFAKTIIEATKDPEVLKTVGKGAADKVYYSWFDSVRLASKRYEHVIENYSRKHYFDELF
ncbi:MAG: glycosyltransferase family 4 protein [Ruminococcaceae bacterium]|nr:glycosyltransferase family 4 protein [Oscillospiraceae bacterium]